MWYEHAVAYVDMKWPRSAGKQRRSIAESLATVTTALLATDRGAPSTTAIRRALYYYAFNTGRRMAGPPPEDLAATVRWLSANTVKLTALTDAALVRKALDALVTLLDGRAAAPTTIARKRAIFYGALRFAVELAPTRLAPNGARAVGRAEVGRPGRSSLRGQSRSGASPARSSGPGQPTPDRPSSPACTTPPCGPPKPSIYAWTNASCRPRDGDGCA
jgi:hypothetical protein